MKKLFLISVLSISSVPVFSQTLGGPCEGCEALLEYGNRQLSSIDTLPDYSINEPKMIVTGTVYKLDGKTPASGVIIYAYHTDRSGIYPTKGDEKGWARRHGYIRGWTKTDENGQYTFYTFQPATYPSRTEPAHVHLTVKEPGKQEYWIDSIQFEEDELLTKKVREKMGNRGGSGIVKLKEKGSFLLAERDIILGMNIQNYH
ncbi:MULTISPECIES: dioxygenase family protein [Roseivirga]|uniref:Intradiol ring-cleavage dioxygenase n=1 Tax=Roseivirga spongicola TaxID=333140 RepID=A0A150XBC2_9BACT|nr:MULTISPECIES: intradiol ring-cleavage dioxygenase [Roseivirga]KYG76021.1 intradiol ring-cleavage dioxygenase [Roseivirga spongicola]MBO6659201.1 intradiol ring-cleavage dioxygenase [Roseivirga sp.]MBO6761226.1 intradiol ring-cleavage dioxygenase [Roseivirga sp.]MBO6908062.1 intradiol ring-cleavage dioxygenase [Roseivirga sp.]WPZ10410.1 intradiol ring-cleavage dioxygenase [Roseivirga spongicola]